MGATGPVGATGATGTAGTNGTDGATGATGASPLAIHWFYNSGAGSLAVTGGGSIGCTNNMNLGLTFVRLGAGHVVRMNGFANARIIYRASIDSLQGNLLMRVRNVTDNVVLVTATVSTTTCSDADLSAAFTAVTGVKELACEVANATVSGDDPNIGYCAVELTP